MRTRLAGIIVTIDGRREPSETLAVGLAGDILVLSTTIAARGITIHSIYTGHEDLDTIAVHLELVPGAPAREVARHARDDLPVTHARDRCLLDHLASVRDVIERASGRSAAVEVRDDALTDVVA